MGSSPRRPTNQFSHCANRIRALRVVLVGWLQSAIVVGAGRPRYAEDGYDPIRSDDLDLGDEAFDEGFALVVGAGADDVVDVPGDLSKCGCGRRGRRRRGLSGEFVTACAQLRGPGPELGEPGARSSGSGLPFSNAVRYRSIAALACLQLHRQARQRLGRQGPPEVVTVVMRSALDGRGAAPDHAARAECEPVIRSVTSRSSAPEIHRDNCTSKCGAAGGSGRGPVRSCRGYQ